jgi:radical S-adenosyl methionine domain-containing protein 2
MNEVPMNKNNVPVPINISWHMWPDCNFSCDYCYATFRDIPSTLSEEDCIKVLELMAESGTQKVTFVGGEPTLCPFLHKLIRRAKELGMVTMLVTNGTRLRNPSVKEMIPNLDWISISIDASDPQINAELGRGSPLFHEYCLDIFEELSKHKHLRLKINTVVTQLNKDDDMKGLIRRLNPERWKVFQVLPIGGQNDGKVERLLITADEFSAYVERHQELHAEGLGPIHEDNEAMTGTYLMMDALGRFFSNKTGSHVYTDSILDAGMDTALIQLGWDVEGFVARQGIYEWRHPDVQTIDNEPVDVSNET